MSKTKSNVIDLLRHPKYLKKLITQKELEEKMDKRIKLALENPLGAM